jgi:hypothetical protein
LTLDREGELTAADLDGSGIGIVRHVDGFKMLLDPASLVDRAQLIHGGWER